MAAFLDSAAGVAGTQVKIYHSSGSTTTAQKWKREGEEKLGSELDRMLSTGEWSTSPWKDTGDNKGYAGTDSRNISAGLDTAKVLLQHMPEKIQQEFAKSWVKFGDTNIAKQAVRQTPAWENEFGYLKRDDGSLIMDELSALATKATYRESLAEVGIADSSAFESQFEQLIKGAVSGAEFQQRIDTVWGSVKNNIPQVESMFREQYNIDSDTPTIFAALINPEIQDKLLKGELTSLTIGAEAKAAGFNRSFSRFESLRKAGMTQDKAREVYQSANTYQTLGTQTGTGFDVGTAEAAAVGDAQAQKQLGLLGAQADSMSSMQTGATKKDDKFTGLLES
jgi:hypothetical protein